MQLAREISPSQLVCLSVNDSGSETSLLPSPSTQMEGGEVNAADTRETQAHQQLLLAAGRGNQAAFSQLVEAYQQPLFAFVANMLGSRTGADDVTQEVFLRVWKAAPRWKPKASVRSFFYLVARRVVYNEFRRRKRKPLESLEQIEEESTLKAAKIQPIDSSAQADKQASKLEFWQAIEEALNKLPKKQRAVLLLRLDGELSYEEIAQSLGMSLSSVKSQLWRARTNLRAELDKVL